MLTAPAPGTIRELVLMGDSNPVRRNGRNAVVDSHCEYSFHDETGLDRCLEALRASDVALAASSSGPYDWKATWVQRNPDGSAKVVFGVSWYDEDFFNAKRNVFLGGMHERMYEAFGITHDDICVTHSRPIHD